MPTDEEFLADNRGIIQAFRENGCAVAHVPFPIVVLEGVPAPA